MPAATKRQKLSATRGSSSIIKPRGIQTFSKVSKVSNIDQTTIQKTKCIESVAASSSKSENTNLKKRKLVEEDEEQSPECIRPTTKYISTCKAAPPKIPQTPKKPIQSQETPKSIETPTKGARSLLDRFCIAAKTPTRSPLFNSSSSDILESTPKVSGIQEKIITQDLPIELVDLVNLHAAFLTALSIHYAHNGTHCPADLRNLCPDVARAWGKRRVLLEDIRRTLGVLNANIEEGGNKLRISILSLSDYGHGKICVEIKLDSGRSGRVARPVNEDLLNEMFGWEIQRRWEASDGDMSPSDFIANLPMEPITTCPSLLKMSPLLAKGQRRLEDLRAGITIKREEKSKPKETLNADGSRPTLLERLRAKQLHQSTLPPPPSKADLVRKQALQRIDEVTSVLVLLSTSSSIGQQRISFTLPTVVSKLRDSFKTPMSKEEADTCVRLLASEIAPEWMKIAKMGKVEALVVNRDERVPDSILRERVARAGC